MVWPCEGLPSRACQAARELLWKSSRYGSAGRSFCNAAPAAVIMNRASNLITACRSRPSRFPGLEENVTLFLRKSSLDTPATGVSSCASKPRPSTSFCKLRPGRSPTSWHLDIISSPPSFGMVFSSPAPLQLECLRRKSFAVSELLSHWFISFRHSMGL